MEKLKRFFDLKSRLDFGFHPVTIMPVLVLLLTIPAYFWLPVHFAQENCLIENAQLVVILAAFIICLNAKSDKAFFNTLAFVMVILFLREINCGRTVFFPVEYAENAFYTWKEIPYGYLAHPLYGAFMVLSGLYFIFSKAYKILWKYLFCAKINLYNWVLVILGIIFGLYGEEVSSPVLEEMAEMLFYSSLMTIIFMQGFNKKYIEAC